MEEKKSYKADLEHRTPLVFAIAVVAVTAAFVGILFIPFKKLDDINMDFFDDYSMELNIKANNQDDMISAAKPEEQQKQESDKLNKVDEMTELPPETLEQTQEETNEDIKEEEKTEEEPQPINLNGDDENKLRIVEQLPEYPGGMVEFMKWLTANLKYPDTALRQKMRGQVMISFIVEQDGTLTNMKIIKSAGQLFDNEAMRVAKLMPKWKPGLQDGSPCRTMIAIPIVFDI